MRNLLIVEDQAELAATLAAAAQELGLAPLVAGGGKDALALAERSPPRAALVELGLPDMRGADLVRQLSALAVPCLAMSGLPSGDPAAGEALQAGAVDFVQKPFAPREVLEALLARLSAEPPEASSAEGLEELLPLEDLGPGDVALEEATACGAAPDGDESDLLDTRHLEGQDDGEPSGAEAVAAAAAPEEAPESSPSPELPATDLGPRGSPPPGPGGAAGALPTDGRAEAGPPGLAPSRSRESDAGQEAPAAPAPGSRSPFPWPLDGVLAEHPLARLLAGFHEKRGTGELRLRRGEVLKVVGLSAGRIYFAASNVQGERLGRFAARSGRLSDEALARLQSEVAGGKGRTADAILALGLLDRANLTALVAQQVREIAWSALDWPDGTYRIALGPRPRRDLLELDLEPVGRLILEGFRRAPSLVRLRELIAPGTRFEPAPDPPFHPADLGLEPDEALVLSHADGTKDLEDLMLLSGLGERAVLSVLLPLWQAGVLRPRAPANSRQRVVLA